MPNTLYYGDNLDVLRHKIRDESIDLCYIDPPFNSKRNYFQIYNNVGKDDPAQAQAFIDTWTWNTQADIGLREILMNATGSYTEQTIELLKGLKAVLKEGGLLAYLVSMAQRVNEIWRVLKPTGSFYLHCDPTCSHYLKLVLDSVFCPRGGDYLNEITWKRTSAHSDSKRNFCNVNDILFFYCKSSVYLFSQQHAAYTEEYVKKNFRYIDDQGRRYSSADLSSPNPRPNLTYEYKGYNPHLNGWKFSRERMEELDQAGRLIFPVSKKGRIRIKKYLNEMSGVTLSNNWCDIDPIASQAAERLGYPTQKPEALLERIIQASSNEGDTILDAYCGCGTTVAVAQRLNRHWIGIDITYQSIALILARLENSFGEAVRDAIVLDGIPRDMDSARALAHKKDDRVRKEFEKWALLTYSKNRAVIQEKKGADRGIDGVAYFIRGAETTERVIFQVKSGAVGSRDLRDLRGTMEREHVALAIFITLEEPTEPMCKEALSAGTYHHVLLNRDYPRMQIVTVSAIIEAQQRIDLPLGLAVIKSAQAAQTATQRDLQLN